jgi:uncharacterized membrane protein
MTDTLFDPPPADPLWGRRQETSRASGRTVDVVGREAEVVNALRILGVGADRSDIQRVLAAEFGLPRELANISRRLTTLERKGVVRRSGVHFGDNGRTTTLWRLV